METDLVEQYNSFEFAKTNWHTKILKCGSVLFLTQFICHIFAQLKTTTLCETTVIPPYLTVVWPWVLSRSIPMKRQIIVLGQCPHLCKQSKKIKSELFQSKLKQKKTKKNRAFQTLKKLSKTEFLRAAAQTQHKSLKKNLQAVQLKLLFQI